MGNIHCGTDPWPAALETAIGWLVEGTATRYRAESAPSRRTLEAPADVERAVCEITGAISSALREPARGAARIWPDA